MDETETTKVKHSNRLPTVNNNANEWQCGRIDVPAARYKAALDLVLSVKSFGLCGAVIACRSTTQKKFSVLISFPSLSSVGGESWNSTHCRIAPR